MAIQHSSAKISQAHLLNHVIKDLFASASHYCTLFRLFCQPNHNILYQVFIFDTNRCGCLADRRQRWAKYSRAVFRVNAGGPISSKKNSDPSFSQIPNPAPSPPGGQARSQKTATLIVHTERKLEGKSHKRAPVLKPTRSAEHPR